jgi:osmotically-inducible protein OsmY
MEDDEMHTSLELEQRAMEQLANDEFIDASNIQVYVTWGTALVTGTVPADAMRILVTRDIAAIPGINSVDNQLEVGQPAPNTKRENMAADIEQLIRENKGIDSAHIKATVIEEGFVILEGHVKTYWEKKLIEDIINAFPGTDDFENRITVVPGNRAEDIDIAGSITENLLESGEVNIDTINITVKNGAVTVSGSVPTWMIYNDVYKAVAVTEGVTHIRMNVDIGTTIG